jgi:seryl-tRNA synthetase
MIVDAETERDKYGGKVRAVLMQLPNMLHESVPYGLDDGDNVELRKMGERPMFDFEPKSHTDIATELGVLDLERAAKVSGAGFYYLRNELALLDYAIMRYAIDHLLKKGFALIEPPYMIHRKPYEGVTDLADFESVMYKIEGEDLYLIATSEHAMGSMLMDEVINAEDLPLRFCGVSPCFRLLQEGDRDPRQIYQRTVQSPPVQQDRAVRLQPPRAELGDPRGDPAELRGALPGTRPPLQDSERLHRGHRQHRGEKIRHRDLDG